MLIQKEKEKLNLKEVKKTFFNQAKPEKDGPAKKSPQSDSQPRVQVYMNSMIVAMERYVLDTLRAKIQDDILPEGVYIPDMGTQAVLDGALVIDGVPIDDYCMVHFKACEIDIKSFYLFKMLFENDNSYLREELLDVDNFDSFLPLTTL